MPYTTDLEKLRLAMFSKKVSQEMLAKKLEIGRSTVWRKMNKKSEFTVGETKNICEYLGVNPTDIFLLRMTQISNFNWEL